MLLRIVICIEAYRDSEESIGIRPPLAWDEADVSEGVGLAVIHRQRKRLLLMVLHSQVSEGYEDRLNGIPHLDQVNECGIQR